MPSVSGATNKIFLTFKESCRNDSEDPSITKEWWSFWIGMLQMVSTKLNGYLDVVIIENKDSYKKVSLTELYQLPRVLGIMDKEGWKSWQMVCGYIYREDDFGVWFNRKEQHHT